MTLFYIERTTQQRTAEKLYPERTLRLLYGDSWISRSARFFLLPGIAKWPGFSTLYGLWQKCPSTAKKIAPFIEQFSIDVTEFADPPSHFRSFNDFFIRRLKPEARPLASDPKVAIIPADGRYYFYDNIQKCPGFIVKGEKFDLNTLLNGSPLASSYSEGSMVIARLCPADYHRFHFPFDCLPGPSQLINGPLYSVNPLAIKHNIHRLAINKRMLCELNSPVFGHVLYLEIGATAVGSIQQTYLPQQWQAKGVEKGYFQFGGSALILLFARHAIQFDDDLLAATAEGLEIRCLLGQSMGRAPRYKP